MSTIKVESLCADATKRLLKLCRERPQYSGATADRHGNVTVTDPWRWSLAKQIFNVTEKT